MFVIRAFGFFGAETDLGVGGRRRGGGGAGTRGMYDPPVCAGGRVGCAGDPSLILGVKVVVCDRDRAAREQRRMREVSEGCRVWSFGGLGIGV